MTQDLIEKIMDAITDEDGNILEKKSYEIRELIEKHLTPHFKRIEELREKREGYKKQDETKQISGTYNLLFVEFTQDLETLFPTKD